MESASPYSVPQSTPVETKKGNGSALHHPKRGFTWPRVFGEGHPYDAIEWEMRTARITKMDGTVVFEQENVEIPSFWTQTAADIVVSKYFRGKRGTPEREWSVKQMIDRVAKTISYWGLEDGYFATPEDANNFNLDLTWLLVNQYFSFNSPVWFNVGVYERPQCSACFILSVEDTMDSILKWYKDEAKIFKGGSGSGLNVSGLRSSKEHLSKGGFSSGPVSFMKGADGVASTIRSGGTTRRAAKMVVMDVDHPDLKDFIFAKQHIEKMTQILVQNGISNSLDGDLFSPYTLLPYQNANNSVRVSDDFMRAVENDEMWGFTARTTGEVLERVRAREIMGWIAEAAWHSADPGMQYDTTINRWHTCSNTGRINASNPCVTGDTLVATDNGLRRIKDLVGIQPMIVSDGGSRRASRVWRTGVRPVYVATTKYGYSLKVTGDHRFFVRGKGDVQAKDLTRGDRLVLQGAGFGAESLEKSFAMTVGYAVGDGCISHKVTRGNPQLTMVGGTHDVSVLQTIASAINVRSGGLNSLGHAVAPVHVYSAATGPRVATSIPSVISAVSAYAVLDKGSAGKLFTDAIYSLDKPSLAHILKGLFTADGTVSGNAEKGFYVGLDSISLGLLEQTQLLLLNFGIKAKLYKNRRTSFVAELPDARREKKSYPVQQAHSLRITRSSRMLFEREVGFVAGTEKAEKLRVINRMTEAYKDELVDEFETLLSAGVEPVYDLTEPITHHFVANGILVHNCSEYMHIDNSACNLASLNLLKFRMPDGRFNVALFKKAVDTVIMAQDIVVDRSSYPTPEIEKNARDYRQLGLGYANLGSLLMVSGLPYDSEEGRTLAGQITSLMCGRAYYMSGLIADIKGPYAGFERNQEPQLNVIAMHLNEAEKLYSQASRMGGQDHDLAIASRMVWHEALEAGRKHGVRNAQMTVLAPTGTIAFMMDCDTTGIEPDIALIKYKKLVGGGMLKLVNNQVPAALERLGYSEQEISDISSYLIEKDTIEGAPHLKEEHLAVFDCAFKAANGQRSISYMGHLRMMSAAQPFVSGAISKTINLPSDATVEDVRDAFVQGWKLGLKAIAIYRDGSKGVQPLSTSKDEQKADSKLVEHINGYTRVKLPSERPSITHRFSVGGYEGYLTVGMYPETNRPGEVFISIAKEGSTVSGLLNTVAILTSMALQSGVPLKSLVRKFKDMAFSPSGFTENTDIPMAKSITDYMFRYLGMRFLTPEEKEEIFGMAHVPAADAPAPAVSESKTDTLLADLVAVSRSSSGNGYASAHGGARVTTNADAPVCQCGTLMVRAGACYSCPNCFATTGVCN